MQDDRQRVRDAVVEVRREDLSGIRSYLLPHPETPELTENLKATPLIQSHDPEIRRKAHEILGGEQDARAAVERIARWVHEELRKIPTVSVPSAVEVLRTRQGDCNEHAVLFAALSRAAGIPTKVSAGLLYQEGRFYYHAWNEVYLGKWFSVDSLLGQFPADATHVKFVEGELERQVQLIPLIGTLQAEILHYQ
jgi:transglutaminase-like putative cysteine protease